MWARRKLWRFWMNWGLCVGGWLHPCHIPGSPGSLPATPIPPAARPFPELFCLSQLGNHGVVGIREDGTQEASWLTIRGVMYRRQPSQGGDLPWSLDGHATKSHGLWYWTDLGFRSFVFSSMASLDFPGWLWSSATTIVTWSPAHRLSSLRSLPTASFTLGYGEDAVR